jgi:hypothetical protein
MFSQMPSNQIAGLNEPAELVCIAFGIPEVDYFWYYLEAGRLTPVNLNTRVMEVNGTLSISMVAREDAGQYVCAASNELGNVSSDPATLTVRGTYGRCSL